MQNTTTLRHKPDGTSFPVMVFLSFAAHSLFILVFLFAPELFPGGKREPFGGPSGAGGLNVMTVDFSLGTKGKPSATPLNQQEPAPAATIRKAKPVEDLPELDSKLTLPDPEKKKKKTDEPTETKTLNQWQRKKEGPFGKGTDRSKDSGKSGNQGRGQFGLGSFGTGDGGPGGFGTGTGKTFPFPWYLETVFRKIELSWSKPYLTDINPKDYGCIIYFVITRSGAVREIRLENSSGVAALDRSAESAILSASPFPPLPGQWTEPDLAFRVRFTYSRINE